MSYRDYFPKYIDSCRRIRHEDRVFFSRFDPLWLESGNIVSLPLPLSHATRMIPFTWKGRVSIGDSCVFQRLVNEPSPDQETTVLIEYRRLGQCLLQ